jgi:D-beta-D-heptose 7-phosphate kinase/D-beta-D-heptose 1-phosphate adenosyltransferase
MVKKIFAELEKIAYLLQSKHLTREGKDDLTGPHYAFLHPEDNSQKILPLYQIKLARLQGKKIVLATGCFDILHREHLKFFKKATREGDVLVVGLESDKRVKKMKGYQRPVNSFKKRAKNLVRIKEVNHVFKLPDDFDRRRVRLKILCSIKPNILAISGQDPLEKEKRKECQKVDCRVKIVHSFNPNISTTKLLSLDKKN